MKVILFGGTGGIGRAITPMLDSEYEVISLGSLDLDITNDSAVKEFFEENKAEIVINFSGANVDGLIHKQSKQTVHHQVSVTLDGTMNILRYAIPMMRENKFGRIICVSSVLARNPIIGTGVYSACKAYIDNIVRTTAMENAKYGITCNSIQLGYFNGGIIEHLDKDFLQSLINKIPMKRCVEPEEIFNTINYMIETEYLTGANIQLTGGL